MECGSRSYRLRMFVQRVDIQKRQLRLPHSMDDSYTARTITTAASPSG
jgi:hypothetical protein